VSVHFLDDRVTWQKDLYRMSDAERLSEEIVAGAASMSSEELRARFRLKPAARMPRIIEGG
jgi:hypothetical protein